MKGFSSVNDYCRNLKNPFGQYRRTLSELAGIRRGKPDRYTELPSRIIISERWKEVLGKALSEQRTRCGASWGE